MFNPSNSTTSTRTYLYHQGASILHPESNTHSAMSQAELAASYAALILADDNVEITVRNFYPLPSNSP